MSEANEPRQMLRLPQVSAKTTLSRSAIYEAIKDRDFPKPIKVTSSLNAWFEDEVDAWLESRDRAAV
ncbi:AlpA family transcriptional regulator [Aliiruegeria haliotis]|uniref:AlpA family transcriptional regulator n=1 Tax=Aliiruegeria haliotis TaxID=1280846 RepID=A0A2T0RUH1_9RHOB|nr:AlpA family phage regulatory protein [Aliiruegeria haliotis]PRY24845.1 AlpA family transcriptional regulator [Aliiruegeria haliotis]